jgi:hypothetical protein
MKKLFFLIAVLVAFISVKAQTVNYAMPSGASYMSVITDYNLTNTTVRNFIYLAPQNFAATQDYLIQLDSVSGNHTNVAVALYGAKFSSSAYSQIGSTVNWEGVSADTTIVISNATANRYRYYKVVLTGTGTGVTKVDSQELKLFDQ